MTIVGVIAEYNPLHNGHAFHLEATRRDLAPDGIIVVMSGHFTQRGEPTIIDKWSRAQMAVAAGADLVIELPTLYACARAPHFAHGGVSLLSQLGLVTHLSFGSEAGDITPLQRLADFYDDDPADFRQSAKQLSKTGLPHPMAQAKALELHTIFPGQAQVAAEANNVLAIEYLRTIKQLHSPLIPWTVKRQGDGYHDLTLGPMASATAVRQLILAPTSQGCLEQSMPQAALAILHEQLALGRGPISWNRFDQSMMILLRRTPVDQLALLPEINEGLETRMKLAADQTTLDGWLDKVKTRRYTRARLVRSLAHLLLGITKNDLPTIGDPIPYARVLAFGRKGQQLLAQARQRSQIPLVTRPSHAYRQLDLWGQRVLGLDILATDLWSTALTTSARTGCQDLTHPVLRLTEEY